MQINSIKCSSVLAGCLPMVDGLSGAVVDRYGPLSTCFTSCLFICVCLLLHAPALSGAYQSSYMEAFAGLRI